MILFGGSGQNQITFDSFVKNIHSFWMFWVQIVYFSHFSNYNYFRRVHTNWILLHDVTQNIWKVPDLRPKHSKNRNFYAKHLKKVVILPKIFKKHRIFILNIEEVFDVDLKQSKIIWFLCNTFEKFRICTQNLRKVSFLDTKDSKSI